MIYQLAKNTFWRLPRRLQISILRTVKPGMVDSIFSLRETDKENGMIDKFDEHRCIFVHVPKTGGIAVKKSLFGKQGKTHHMRIKEFSILFDNRKFNRYFKFTFVRNPWDRVVSAYEFLQEGGINESDRRYSQKTLSQFNGFTDFVMNWLAPNNGYGEIHFIPQYEFLCLDGANPKVDYVGRFEKLDRHFDNICRSLDIEARLSEENKSSRETDYRKYYNNETRHKVRKIYKKDIDMFGYSF